MTDATNPTSGYGEQAATRQTTALANASTGHGHCRICGRELLEVFLDDPKFSAVVIACGTCGWSALRSSGLAGRVSAAADRASSGRGIRWVR